MDHADTTGKLSMTEFGTNWDCSEILKTRHEEARKVSYQCVPMSAGLYLKADLLLEMLAHFPGLVLCGSCGLSLV